MTSVLDDLPKTLKIGFAEWTIKVVDKGSITGDDPDANCLGICESEHFVIKIAKGQNDTQAKNTFIHELMHAIYFVQGLPTEGEEEFVVTSLTNGLMAVLKDNPELQAWWVNQLCEDTEYA